MVSRAAAGALVPEGGQSGGRSGGPGGRSERRSERWSRAVEACWCRVTSDSPYIPCGTVKTPKAVAANVCTSTQNRNIHRSFRPKRLKKQLN